jgi:hypothetical protein
MDNLSLQKGAGACVTLRAASKGSIVTMKICWKIEHFSFRHDIMLSPPISCEELKEARIAGQWSLLLQPKSLCKSENGQAAEMFVSLYLYSQSRIDCTNLSTRLFCRLVFFLTS